MLISALDHAGSPTDRENAYSLHIMDSSRSKYKARTQELFLEQFSKTWIWEPTLVLMSQTPFGRTQAGSHSRLPEGESLGALKYIYVHMLEQKNKWKGVFAVESVKQGTHLGV